MAEKRRRKPDGLSDQLRTIIETCGLSKYAICKRAGIDPSQMHRFVHGTGWFSAASLDRIGAALGLRLVQDEE
jgi:hypothetical protein